MKANLILFAIMSLSLSGCIETYAALGSENHVEEVKSEDDTHSFYKVPVVYGIGIAENSLPIGPGEVQGNRFGFAEYDPEIEKGTSDCILGSRDVISIRFPISSWYGQLKFDHKLHYHVIMVPPGFYAVETGDNVSSPYPMHVPEEAKPSLYFEIKSDGPQYLGDFWLIKSPGHTFSSPSMNLANPELSTLPVEYRMDEASNVLQAFNISPEGLKKVTLIPTKGWAKVPICLGGL